MFPNFTDSLGLLFTDNHLKWTALPFVLDKVDPILQDETHKAQPRGPTTQGKTKSQQQLPDLLQLFTPNCNWGSMNNIIQYDPFMVNEKEKLRP